MRSALTANVGVTEKKQKHFNTPFIWKVIRHPLFLQVCVCQLYFTSLPIQMTLLWMVVQDCKIGFSSTLKGYSKRALWHVLSY